MRHYADPLKFIFFQIRNALMITVLHVSGILLNLLNSFFFQTRYKLMTTLLHVWGILLNLLNSFSFQTRNELMATVYHVSGILLNRKTHSLAKKTWTDGKLTVMLNLLTHSFSNKEWTYDNSLTCLRHFAEHFKLILLRTRNGLLITVYHVSGILLNLWN